MSDEIRAWAREQGLTVADKGRLPADVREAYEAWHAADEVDGEPMLLTPAAAPIVLDAPEQGSPAPEVGGGEKPPQVPPKPRRGLFDRKPRPPGPKPRKATHRRVPVDTLCGTVLSLSGLALSRNEATMPAGRTLMLQSEADGMLIEEAVRGTIIDKFLQPLARGSEKGEIIFAVTGPPMIVAAMTARPELAPALMPALKLALTTHFRIAGPALERAAKRAKEWEEAMGDVDIQGFIDMIFAPPPVPMSPDVAEHARKQAGQDGTA